MKYDLTPAAFARYLAYEAQVEHGDNKRAEAWRIESWRLWDKKSSLLFDPTGLSYYNNPDEKTQEQYNGMGWLSYPESHYDRIAMETDLYLIAREYDMGSFLGIDLVTGKLIEARS